MTAHLQKLESHHHDSGELHKKASRKSSRSFDCFASHIDALSPCFRDLSREFLDALLAYQRHRATDLTLNALRGGMEVRDLYLNVFQPVLYEIGRLWQINQITIAQEHYCTASIQLILAQLYSHLPRVEPRHGTIVAACVSDELHEFGIRMVADFFEMEGWKAIYLGAQTSKDAIIEEIVRHQAEFLAVSATMNHQIDAIKELIDTVHKAKLPGLRIIVGGRPFNLDPSLWRKLGADGWASNAKDAVELAHQLRSV